MKKLVSVLALAAVLGAAVCGIAPANAAVKDEVIAVLRAEPSNIDPHGNSELAAMSVQVQVFETLVKKDAKGNIVPCLAKSWEKINDKTMRFKLRDDVYFHNGDKLTAEDVAFTIQRATKKPMSASIFAAFDGEKTRAVDATTVDIATKKPFAALFNYLTSTRGGIISKRAVTEMGDAKFGRAPVGTGPFTCAGGNWVTGTSITLKRNDKYWGKKPQYKTLTFKFITETANRALEIESGNADIVYDPDTNDLERLKTVKGIKVLTGNSYGFSYIIISLDDKGLADIRLRQALSLALDTTEIVKSVYGAYGTPAESVVPRTIFAYSSQGKHEYNIEKAKKLMAEAGHPNGMEVSLHLPSSKEQQDIGIIAQNMWKKIGVTAKISTMSMSELIASGHRGQNQIAIYAATYSTGDPGHALASFDTRNASEMHPNDKNIDAMLDQGNAAYDPKERAAVYAKIQDYIYHKYFMIPIGNKTVNYLITNQVQGFTADPGNIPVLADVVVSE